jgi:SAM-dependent methyltransferase
MSYDPSFYSRRKALSRASAQVVLGDLIPLLKPRSMLDVGCGTGSWLSVAREMGVEHVVGIDGSSVPESLLELPAECFVAQDLNNELAVSRRFDLAMCLEVAEHLSPGRGEGLVAELAASSDAVLFGAAIPEQIGTHHINCRWQSYWSRLFEAHGYSRLAFVQQRFWHDRRVNVVYRQNAAVYLRRSRYSAEQWETLSAQLGGANFPVDVVHPELYMLYLNQLRNQFAAA